LLPLSIPAAASTHYVDLNSTNPVAPYLTWATAAPDIQQAVDISTNGDSVLVTNGIYRTGGRVVFGALTNRVVVNKTVTVQSVNGPTVTAIEGNPGIGDSAVRCIYLGSGSVLLGFTVTNGATRGAGDTSQEQSGGGIWCENTSVMVSNCVIAGNSASYFGGGAFSGTLNNCALWGNYTGYRGGGVFGGMLNYCSVVGNRSDTASGGARESSLSNCLVVSNSAALFSGGAEYCTLNQCTIAANSGSGGGSISICNATNCIVYDNSGEPNWQTGTIGTLDHCCTTPLPPTNLGSGNFTNDPVFLNLAAGDFHLACSSPCINTGDNGPVLSATDLDGNPRIVDGNVDVGAYEFHLTAPLSVSIQTGDTTLVTNYPLSFQGSVDVGCGRVTYWDFGDGTTISNQLTVSHAWTSLGDYAVVLRAFNELNPGGVSATATVHVVSQRIYYVDAGGTNPVAPYRSWATAATRIQDAIDIALPVPNSLVLVTNGLYQLGGKAVYGSSNRVAVTKPIVVQSVNGAAATTIQGYQVPSWGAGSVRCAYLTNGATLVGFTLTGGSSLFITADLVRDASGGGVWCESTNALVSDCVIVSNTASYGGGGVYSGSLSNCALAGNFGRSYGGGAYLSTLSRCLLSSNTATYQFSDGGGGSRGCIAYNCTLTRNSANYGGGDFGSILQGCVLIGNSAGTQGGGACNSVLTNCTLTGNSAGTGGGAAGGALNNCIIYYNTAGNGSNYSGAALNYCCTLPLPGSGAGNIGDPPQLADPVHLAGSSPCRAAGNAAYAAGTDIDGEAWLNPPSIGCDEYHAGSITGALTVSVPASATNTVANFVLSFVGQIAGHAASNQWNFGDGVTLDNGPASVSHSWAGPGDYVVILRAYNESYPAGITASVIIHVVDETHYVALDSANPVAPYLSWATAATNIQDAIDTVVLLGATVLVSNGVYQTGGRAVNGALTNRVAATKSLVLRSVNGPDSTIIQGRQMPGTTNGSSAIACVYLTNGASLIGFTLTNGATLTSLGVNGGGVYCASANCVVSNCVLIGNAAFLNGGGAFQGTLQNCSLINNVVLAPGSFPGVGLGGPNGGGAFNCALNNCVLKGNLGFLGGGAAGGTLNNCLLVSNTAARGGGAYSFTATNCTFVANSGTNSGGGAYLGTLNNCIVVSNVSPSGSNYASSTLNYCCAVPLSAGPGNFSNDPLLTAAFRLQSNSPCINAGNNAYALTATDLDDNPRIAGGTIDIGAYEYQTPSSLISYGWLQQYGFPTDGSADYTDADGDGMNNWQEWIAGTDPTDASSLLRISSLKISSTNCTVTWPAVTNRAYNLQRSTNLTAGTGFLNIQSNLRAFATNVLTATDSIGTNKGPFFYRLQAVR
jgi:hypothetical protein